MVTVHIEDVPTNAILATLLAVERADKAGRHDEETHRDLAPLVLGLRNILTPSAQEAPK